MPATLTPRVRLPANPKADPRFQRVEAKLKSDVNRVKQHPPARKKAAEAQAAAKGPPNEKLAGAKAKQVDKMQEAPTGKPDPDSFLALLRAEIEKVLPKNNTEAKDFVDEGQKAQVTQNVGGNIKDQKDSAARGVQTASGATPNQSGVPQKEVTPIPGERAAAAPQVDAAGAMPAPKPDSEISLQHSKDAANKEMADNRITTTQCQKANDPRFSAVLTSKSNLDRQADTAPQQYRAQERGVLTQTAAKATAEARKGAAGVASARNRSGGLVSARQSAAQLKDEQRRQEFTATIEGIYNRTKQNVESKLNSLETDVMRDFGAGIDRGLNRMKTSAQREIDLFYADRYSGFWGWKRWLTDKFKDTPEGVKTIIREARARFTTEMDGLVVRIAATVERRLQEAKDLIAKSQSEVKTEVDKLPKNLKGFGQQAEREMGSRFDEMRQGVEERKNELASKLAEKYKEAGDKADAAAKKMEAENAGLFKRLADFLGEIIRIIRDFTSKLMALLRKAASVIMDILSDPVGFLGSLLSAIKQGIGQFVSNIWEHLKAGFMEWLFGSLASAGIEIPADLSLPSILKLVLSVLGITYDRLRAKAVKLIGERNVRILEKLYEYVRALITEGPAALWEKVKDDLGNLKEMVIDAIQSWLITTIVKKATLKLISMFNPVGAFVQAVLLIYDTVVFLIQNASKILLFIEAVINSVSAIVAGAVSEAANRIEEALARMIPLVIGFLARLLGLGGISEKIKETIKKVQGLVDKAIDKVLAKTVAVVKKLFGKGEKTPVAPGTTQLVPQLAGDSVRPVVNAPFQMAGKRHTIIFEPKGSSVEIFMASQKLPMTAQFSQAHIAINALKHYIDTIEDPVIKKDYETNILPRIVALQSPQVQSFNEIYNERFPREGAGIDDKEAKRRVAELVKAAEALLAQLKEWAGKTGIADLGAEEIDKTINEKGKKLWAERWQAVNKDIKAVIAGFTYKGKVIGFTGSAATGWRKEHKGLTHFDVTDFDVDMFVVHPADYQAAEKKGAKPLAGKIFPSRLTPDLSDTSRAVARALAKKFPGVARVADSTIVLKMTP